jgi:putative ABC transport system permease protein
VQVFSEAAVLSVVALMCALIVAAVGIAAIGVPSVAAIALATLTTFKFWVTLVAILLFVSMAAGFYPALVLSTVRPIQAVHTGKVRGGGRFMSRLLVGLQFAGASFLIIAMLVMSGQNERLRQAEHQHSASTLVSIANDVSAARVNFDALKSELELQPHVESVSAAMISPWVMVGSQGVITKSPEATATKIPVMMNRVHFDFFSTMGIQLLAGRAFERTRADDSASAPQTNIVVDREFAEQHGWLPLTAAIDKTLYTYDESTPGAPPQPRTVIGVVETRATSIMSPMGATASTYVLTPTRATEPIVRISTTDVAAALREIETVWSRLAPDVALKLEFADQILERNHRVFQVISTVFSGVAVLALFISLLGLVGMSIDVIAKRRHEIGVRKTLGASVQTIVRLLLTDFSKPVLIANLLVWPLAFVAMQAYLSIFTQRVGLSIAPFVASLALTVLIAWIAVAAQATRAARLNPATVLRYE